MFKQASRVILGVLVGLILTTLVWYLISGLTTDQDSSSQRTAIKDDLLSNPVINQVKEKLSVISYPVTVGNGELGVKDPFE